MLSKVTLALSPARPPPNFILQLWRKIGTLFSWFFFHSCEIKSGSGMETRLKWPTVCIIARWAVIRHTWTISQDGIPPRTKNMLLLMRLATLIWYFFFLQCQKLGYIPNCFIEKIIKLQALREKSLAQYTDTKLL